MEVARCMKCKANRSFAVEPVYENKQTSRGVKGLLRGACSECKTSMCKLVKVRS